ncbi:phosphotransferase [Kitasatospora sp. NBC_01287]|uniref:phosphotransferase n=1 Tax=Kitasatospora sp. NBC_01287 TaxID=2903573 RepID=UPI0022599E15|nr:phosphotransferase [Kitasatospora sp. NBC_01287]MCX4750016.1 phosphotransferase [Kitasatospora sp. NBC_01287]
MLTDICTSTHRPQPTRREMRVWDMSGVERLTFPDGATAIYKYAVEPFATEDQILKAARRAGIPVPEVHGSISRDGILGMVIEDLGEEAHQAGDTDGVVAAVALHEAEPFDWLPVMDEDALTALPALALGHLRRLREGGRWLEGTEEIAQSLTALTAAGAKRAIGAELAPFGWVHSEFHPTSLHLGQDAWFLLDFARAFTGPGLLDLASWHGTLDTPEPARLRAFIEAYVAAGGHRDALAERGGLAPEAWALGWHRVWACEWFMEQAHRWINNPADDPVYIGVVRQHLEAAVRLLEA